MATTSEISKVLSQEKYLGISIEKNLYGKNIFSDLGLSSLDYIGFILELEEVFSISILDSADFDFSKFLTIQDINKQINTMVTNEI